MVRPKLKKSLRAVFETDVRRIAMPISLGKSEIEVAFD
jgi:inorganic triphosphatase YgiF